MNKKACLCVLVLAGFCTACSAPSLRYKTDVNKLTAQGKFENAAQHITSKEGKMYAKKDKHLYALDKAVLLHDAHQPRESDNLLSLAQNRIDELYTQSVTATVGTLVLNDLTLSYRVDDYEQAFTYFYRMMNFWEQGDVSSAAVEARKAVFFLDNLRGQKKKGYNDDPFIQYVASLAFESVGQISDARIARQNALNGYQKASGNVQTPYFPVPQNVNDLGEVIIFHYNGLMPLKTSQTLQLAWDKAMSIASSPKETNQEVAPEVQNAVYAGVMGNAITISFPKLEKQHYWVTSSMAVVGGQQYPLTAVADLERLAFDTLEEQMPAIWFRTVTRAVVKRIAAVQARAAAKEASKDDTVGELAGMIVSFLGAVTEKADTRQWFTLPAQIYMTRLFLPVGKQDISLFLKDQNGNIIKEYTFEDVVIKRGDRVFLHYRSAF